MNSLGRMLVLTALLIAGGCGKPSSPSEKPGELTYPYRGVCTVGMVKDIVARVAGTKGAVTGIVGTGVDPHLYKPTRSDVVALLQADIIFYSGLMLEGKMTDALVKVATRGKPVNAVTELIDEGYLLEPVEFAGHYDPHVWMDVRGWIKAVEIVPGALADFDPIHRDYYQANARAYIKELEELDAYAKTCIASIPENRRVLITAHDAFNYFGRAYGIEVKGIQGISTESEAGIQDINRLVQTIVEREIPAVFVESTVAIKNVKALIEGAKAAGKELRIGGSLFSDAMGNEGTYEGTYIGMMDHNVTTITRALGGKAPEKGLHGKLGGAHD